MIRMRSLCLQVFLCGIIAVANVTPNGGWIWSSARAAEDALRPEVGKPLQAAQELLKAQKYKEALAKVNEADAVSGKSAYESFIVERMRGAAAAGAGDTATAVKAFEATIASGRLPAAEQLKLMEALAGTAYRGTDYAKAQTWAQRYIREGGTSSSMRTLLSQTQYLAGDYAGAAKELSAEIAAAEHAGQVPKTGCNCWRTAT